jgi:hypothetical protein
LRSLRLKAFKKSKDLNRKGRKEKPQRSPREAAEVAKRSLNAQEVLRKVE